MLNNKIFLFIFAVLLISSAVAYDSCLVPDSLGDTQTESVRSSGEKSLQTFLDNDGYTLDVDDDQTNIQIWEASEDVELEITYLGGVFSYPHAYGYYLNGNEEDFNPLFQDFPYLKYAVPVASPGFTDTINVNKGDRIAFAIDVKGSFNDSGLISTENSVNPSSRDHVVAYDADGEYVLGFEDTFRDWDFQDLIVSVKITKCESESLCGNGMPNENEGCDDGNEINDDDCSNECTINSCGDGEMNQWWEQCDDGNMISGDGCDAECYIEEEASCYSNLDCGADYDSGNFCSGNSIVKNHTSNTCNNPGQVNSYCSSLTTEINVEDCSHMCMDGTCHEPPAQICGNSIPEDGEQCDDGNLINGDGCSSQCTLETPLPICGNEVVETNEQCDEGSDNGVACDNDDSSCNYCTSSCQIKHIQKKGASNNDNENLLLSYAGGCTPNWECSAWSECVSGLLRRNCADTNKCYIEINKPSETTKCMTQKVLVDEEEEQSNHYWLWVIAALLVLIIVVLFNFKSF